MILGDILGSDDEAKDIAEDFARATAPGPLESTSGAGTATFTTAPGSTGVDSLDLELSDPLQTAEGTLFGVGGELLSDLEGFDLESYTQKYYEDLQALREPSIETEFSRLMDKMNLGGTTGLATFTGLQEGTEGAVNPLMNAFYDSILAQQSQDALTSQTAALNQFGTLMGLGTDAFQGAFGLYDPLLDQMGMTGNLSGQAANQAMAGSTALMDAEIADASGGGFFDDILGFGMSAMLAPQTSILGGILS